MYISWLRFLSLNYDPYLIINLPGYLILNNNINVV